MFVLLSWIYFFIVKTTIEIVNSNANKSEMNVIKDKLLIERVLFFLILLIRIRVCFILVK
jgi:hypothetical protein